MDSRDLAFDDIAVGDRAEFQWVPNLSAGQSLPDLALCAGHHVRRSGWSVADARLPAGELNRIAAEVLLPGRAEDAHAIQ